MPESIVSDLRSLRARCRKLNDLVVADYKNFFDSTKELFFHLPSAPPATSNSISVTTTATALMALGQAHRLEDVLCPEKKSVLPAKALQQLTHLLSYQWSSADLSQNNAFTTAFVVRAAGWLVRHRVVETGEVNALKRAYQDIEVGKANAPISDGTRKFNGKTLNQIAELLIKQAPNSLGVMRYSPTPPIAYWLVSGAVDLEVPKDTALWRPIAEWLVGEFSHQVSLITADHPALMDPVALAMAAAACRRLDVYVPDLKRAVRWFPTKEELLNGVRLFMAKQNSAGTWGKFFPLFHYPTAGANHCWHVEVLEALLNEFPEILDDSHIVNTLDRAIHWLETNRLNWLEGARTFRGWNAGGQLDTLARGEPESWATGVVHMMARTLADRLSLTIRQRILRTRRSTTLVLPDASKWKEILDCCVPITGSDGKDSVKRCIDAWMIEPILAKEKAHGRIKKLPESVKRSALLFGPPGTGKTRMVRSIAKAIGWDFVEILPSDFLVDGLDGVYSSAKSIFDDLGDLDRAVIFFDEMDALLQRRVDEGGKQTLTVQQQFMTTSMLPHLAALYDAGKVLFFFATNYRQSFDAAITRPGRFDMLLFVGPTNWELKATQISQFADFTDPTKEGEVGELLLKWIPKTDGLADHLTRATFSETRSLFRQLCAGKPLDTAVLSGALTGDAFRRCVDQSSKAVLSLCIEGELRSQYEEEREMSEVRW